MSSPAARFAAAVSSMSNGLTDAGRCPEEHFQLATLSPRLLATCLLEQGIGIGALLHGSKGNVATGTINAEEAPLH
jgi:hypothetical protein